MRGIYYNANYTIKKTEVLTEQSGLKNYNNIDN